MTLVFERFLIFWNRSLPSLATVALIFPISLLYTITTAKICGLARVNYQIDVAYTRKLFHFFIIGTVGFIHYWKDLSGVVVFGITVTVAVIIATYYGDGFPFYEAMARQSDDPNRKLFVLIPLACTALGGVASNIFFPHGASIGYWVCGYGDGLGEPVGKRWGNHRYQVPSMAGVTAERSLEGSLAVLFGGTTAAGLDFWFRGLLLSESLTYGLLCGLIGMAVENSTTHGLDNFTIIVIVSATAQYLLT